MKQTLTKIVLGTVIAASALVGAGCGKEANREGLNSKLVDDYKIIMTIDRDGDKSPDIAKFYHGTQVAFQKPYKVLIKEGCDYKDLPEVEFWKDVKPEFVDPKIMDSYK